MVSTTFGPGLRPLNISHALQIASDAVAPDGLGPFVHIWKILFGFVKHHTGIDIKPFSQKAILAIGALIGTKLLWSHLKPLLLDLFTTSVEIPIEHQTAKAIRVWADQHTKGNFANNHLTYRLTGMVWNKATQREDFVAEKGSSNTGGLFRWKGKPFYISYDACTANKTDKEEIQGLTLNRNCEPIMVTLSGHAVTVRFLRGYSKNMTQEFLKSIEDEQSSDTKTTPVFVHTGASGRLFSRKDKPIRSFDTIDLDAQTKADLIKDTDRFFAPATVNWYGSRGIPYKRGYLLSGPPGTGKSSISMALAGHIAAPLYIIPLGSVQSENSLRQLFEHVDQKSIVLLEDIDSAGIVREQMKPQKAPSKSKKPRASPEGFFDFVGNAPPAEPTPISLSGLLNAIDALADGSLLIMTTNAPESLDQALIRPGRIDKQIHVGYASQDVAENIYKRFYAGKDGSGYVNLETEQLAQFAARFASKIPALKLTPAEIQGYLIPLCDDPEGAIAGVDNFVAALLAARAAGKNIIEHDGRPAGTDEGYESEPEFRYC